ncbi:aldo/keto reductase [Paraburkholderia caballeronis]|uniref:aldo/keto reductase n=1 Tax=Paraburkholderia caballeronis TaxID=416943 RepID=UPI0010664DDD|nr:aldo/keto reductase [Paraburkholderia caballeronis]TDV09280.1 D-threo-aldose 1-dehydrogenase [Paraburkholderia caballeronis]TDV12340.1 D-threo-aldose 1-dehydrogenase [Paraburkholderia caballeronis]TDV22813.1 D-threo-aldose 1-dehydrogenase [Paraburkholderia caballeronis]
MSQPSQPDPTQIAQRRRIGRTALEVTALSLGTAPLGGLYRDLTEEEAQATVDAAWNAGIRFFDTAPHYGHTKAEHRLGAALRRHPRGDYVLSTKVGRRFVPRTHPDDGSEGWQNPLPFEAIYDYTYDGILRSFEDSQQRLGITDIDILLVHDIGRFTHGDRHPHYWQQLTGGGFRALDELRSRGAVKAIGFGVNEREVILDAIREFDIDCALLAGRYTLLEQAPLDDLLPKCIERGVSILLGGAFNSGILAHGVEGDRKFNYGAAPPDVIERVARLDAVCRAHGVPLAAAALQFPYAHPAVATVLNGARSVAELQENVASFARPIPSALWTALRDEGLLDARAPAPRA